MFQKIFGIEKFYGQEGGNEGVSQFSIKNFLSHSTGKLRKGTLLCLTKFRVSKNFLPEGGRTIFWRLSHSTEKFRKGTLLCFRETLVSKNFLDKKGGGRECHNFSSKICCFTVPENFVREPLSV